MIVLFAYLLGMPLFDIRNQCFQLSFFGIDDLSVVSIWGENRCYRWIHRCLAGQECAFFIIRDCIGLHAPLPTCII